MTRVEVLTPAGSAAIAVVRLRGPNAWNLASAHFRPARGELAFVLGRFLFGRFGRDDADEVILLAHSAVDVEVHCHGGRHVVRWVVRQLVESGAVEAAPELAGPWAWLSRAPTLRTASILLDQCRGAFARACETEGGLRELARHAALGRHLVEPWRVVLAGAPNVGKSRLVNALAGYERAVVSPVAGTTRDATTTATAFDGWPVELVDTAGLRDADEELEAEGIARAEAAVAAADLVLGVFDASSAEPIFPRTMPRSCLLVANKIDLGRHGESRGIGVSAATGEGVLALIAAVVRALVPDVPPPGAAVPYSPDLAARVLEAACGNSDAIRKLRAAGRTD